MSLCQMLNARIGNHVEIGANTCIDRGSWRDTVIGDYSKIDNLVQAKIKTYMALYKNQISALQIGHNVIIGKSCMLCGQTGIAGSVTIGDFVTLGGRVAVRDHVSIATKPDNRATVEVTRLTLAQLQACNSTHQPLATVPFLLHSPPPAVAAHFTVRLAANSCVTKDITQPGDYGGFPAVPIHEWRRQIAYQYRISKKGIA
ncbi:hypothetical protein Pint_10866 [Pistacia integerrima]|uniref:Uncharacterized protein n=1 Tax=Pistacia integerrima TaxID=434235 RepID=A0ACC0XH87_9ROSI|nr:hypothetical protein Pint_10866 [Pistacia integerrima]